MADIDVIAAYGSVVEDDEEGLLFIGFAEGEDEDEPYVLFRQALSGGPIWLEIGSEEFGAEDAVSRVIETASGIEIVLDPAQAASFGFATSVGVKIGPDCEDGAEALAALREMFASVWQKG
ncbi:hypothetical protein Q9295_06190 [Xinfangfangia sp. CPCC 101601]|uniref:Uncharacterized protein n=1 Tax=Pseudogemmobacter lacusdianii TaxID=3069608 RepID=A0ABU0VWS3_9RHOB|nr:hypothetical protein [Xinfangfangia sp. CPCC 101601]MDQ2065953.1 hypothetical protein [Xinfangfangia sp. CPCC 101601]